MVNLGYKTRTKDGECLDRIIDPRIKGGLCRHYPLDKPPVIDGVDMERKAKILDLKGFTHFPCVIVESVCPYGKPSTSYTKKNKSLTL